MILQTAWKYWDFKNYLCWFHDQKEKNGFEDLKGGGMNGETE